MTHQILCGLAAAFLTVGVVLLISSLVLLIDRPDTKEQP